MRTGISSVLLVFLSFGTALSGGWHQIPNEFVEQFNGIYFADESHGFIAEKNGTIFTVTETAGKWKFDKISFGEMLEDIYFLDNGRVGFAFGAKGIIRKTTDRSRHWVHDTLDPDVQFYDMKFFDSTVGILVGIHKTEERGTQGIIYRTSNGGRSWNLVETDGKRFRSICLSSEGLAAITGIGNILLSDDYGQSWTRVMTPTNSTPRATAISGKKGIMVGMRGFLALSDDRGKSWEEKEIIPQKINLFDILMIDSRRAYAVGTGGEILYTEDSGRNWIPEASNAVYDLYDIQRVGNRIFVCGKAGSLVYKQLEE